jgi:hypothetical protein
MMYVYRSALVMTGHSLFVGFRPDLVFPHTDISITEVRNLQQILTAFGLEFPPFLPRVPLVPSEVFLTDIASAVTRDLNVPVGLRRHPVAVGIRRVLLPMPDELPELVRNFCEWFAVELTHVRQLPLGVQKLERALVLAADVHARFVHVHPFADGNGRTARLLSGLVLLEVGLPSPIIQRDSKTLYMNAVSDAVMLANYSSFCAMHVQAVEYALQEVLQHLRLTAI